jgi:hypothetical protein
MPIAVASTGVFDELPRFMTNVTNAELDIIRSLFDVWRKKYSRNVLRSAYFDGKVPVKDLGISTPPQVMNRLRAVLGWPAKSVTALAQRNVFDGFVVEGSEQDPFDLLPLLEANRFDAELPQAITSAYKHSCSFITTALGDEQEGDPKVVIMARSAEWSAAIWDKRRRCVAAMLAITNADDQGRPTSLYVDLPEVTITAQRRSSGSWVAERQDKPFKGVLVEPITYDPQLDRPFGRSRISRPVMSITDSALRSVIRGEVAAEFYTAPRMAALGVSQDAFSKGKWQAAIDRWFALTRDEEGEIPHVQQFPQMTMQPITDQFRAYASQFAGETGLALSSLGIVQDNPPSAEAMYAAEKDLIVEARASNRNIGAALQRMAQRVVMLRDELSEPSDELRRIRANWVNPAFTSPVTAADALVKLSTVFPWLSESEVALEYAGFTQPEVTRLLADKRRAQSGNRLQALAAIGQGAAAGATAPAAAPAAPAGVEEK